MAISLPSKKSTRILDASFTAALWQRSKRLEKIVAIHVCNLTENLNESKVRLARQTDVPQDRNRRICCARSGWRDSSGIKNHGIDEMDERAHDSHTKRKKPITVSSPLQNTSTSFSKMQLHIPKNMVVAQVEDFTYSTQRRWPYNVVPERREVNSV